MGTVDWLWREQVSAPCEVGSPPWQGQPVIEQTALGDGGLPVSRSIQAEIRGDTLEGSQATCRMAAPLCSLLASRFHDVCSIDLTS